MVKLVNGCPKHKYAKPKWLKIHKFLLLYNNSVDQYITDNSSNKSRKSQSFYFSDSCFANIYGTSCTSYFDAIRSTLNICTIFDGGKNRSISVYPSQEILICLHTTHYFKTVLCAKALFNCVTKICTTPDDIISK